MADMATWSFCNLAIGVCVFISQHEKMSGSSNIFLIMKLKTVFSLEFNMATTFASIKSNKKGISVKGIFLWIYNSHGYR